MKRPLIVVRIAGACLVATLVIGLGGCQQEPLPVPPAPPPLSVATTSPISQAPPPVSTVPTTAGLTVTLDKATVSFPDKITFSLQANSPLAINSIELEYGTDKHTLVSETNRIKPVFTPGKEVNANWDWQMKKTGSIPPGATVWWRWVTTVNDETQTTVRKSLTYTDTRFQWQSVSLKDADFYWYGQNESLVKMLTGAVQQHLARIELNVSIPPERKPKVFVYTDSEELKGAVLFEPGWTGALAYPQYNIVLTAVNTNNLDWAMNALPHEITHLLVGEAIFGPFGGIPTWLNEGLARYSETDQLSRDDQQALDDGIRANKLISVRSLGSTFPADTGSALLAYAESSSVVRYLIKQFGWPKMRDLLQVFKEGATYDKALQQVYGLDTDGLEAQWKASLGR
jgi:hypothetical protein